MGMGTGGGGGFRSVSVASVSHVASIAVVMQASHDTCLFYNEDMDTRKKT